MLNINDKIRNEQKEDDDEIHKLLNHNYLWNPIFNYISTRYTNPGMKQIEFKEELVMMEKRKVFEGKMIENGFDEIKNVLNGIINGNKEINNNLNVLMKEKEIKNLLNKILNENKLERNRNNEIGDRLKEMMDLMILQKERMDKMDNNEMKVKLNGIHNLIENGDNKERINEIEEKLERLESLISNYNNEYKPDYDNLIEIVNKGYIGINNEMKQILNDNDNDDNDDGLEINNKLKYIVNLLYDQQCNDNKQMDLVNNNYNTKTNEIKEKLKRN